MDYKNINYNQDYFLISKITWKIENKLNLPKHGEKFPIYLIIFSLIYDILYNNMIINKLYYISFILFFYYLMKKLNNALGMFYKGDSIFIYRYLYKKEELDDWDEKEKQERIVHINKELLKALDRGKLSLPTDYDENRLIRLSWSTYLLIITTILTIHALYFGKLEIFVYDILIHNVVIILFILLILLILWYHIKNIIIENVFLILNTIIIISWLIIFINHKVPLLFHEILLETQYCKIIDGYNVQEKVIFIKEYFMFKMKYFNINEKVDLLKIFKSIPFHDLLQNVTINEIKLYVDNLIEMYERLENNIYPLLKEDLNKQVPNKLDNIVNYFARILKLLIYYKK